MRLFLILFLVKTHCAFEAWLEYNPKIVGGSLANIADVPYHVSVESNGYNFCGGSIINSNYVLTAAHCVVDEPVYLMNVRTGTNISSSGGQAVKVCRIIVHPSYDDETVDFDVALLQLCYSLRFNEFSREVMLPAIKQDLPVGKLAVVSGWGSTQPVNSLRTVKLRRVAIRVMSMESCKNYYPGEITPRMFCAGYPKGGKDSCQGDSGGPLVINGTQFGIVSWGNGCAQPGYPGIYTKVSAVRRWINKYILQ